MILSGQDFPNSLFHPAEFLLRRRQIPFQAGDLAFEPADLSHDGEAAHGDQACHPEKCQECLVHDQPRSCLSAELSAKFTRGRLMGESLMLLEQLTNPFTLKRVEPDAALSSCLSEKPGGAPNCAKRTGAAA